MRPASPPRAVTFDFWNTVMWEPPGALESARTREWTTLLDRLGCPRADGAIVAAHAAATRLQQAAWHRNEQYVTTDATAAMCAHLDLDLDDAGIGAFDLVFERAALHAGVRPCDGVEPLLAALHARGVRLAIICDIGLTPAAGVRALLRDAGLLGYFDATVFSDEQGVYKPDARIFEFTLATLGVDADAALHVGDRRRTDVEGALGCGMSAARYRGVFDDLDATLRDAPIVVDTHSELAGALAAGVPVG